MSNTGLTIEQISIHALREEGDSHKSRFGTKKK